MSHTTANKSYKKKFTTKYVPDFPNVQNTITLAKDSNVYQNGDLLMADPKEIQSGGRRAFAYRKTPDGKNARILVMTDKQFCLGFKANHPDDDNETVSGYSAKLFLYNKDGPTDYQRELVETFQRIQRDIAVWCVKNGKEVGRPDLIKFKSKVQAILDGEYDDNPLFPVILQWQIDEETGERMADKGPGVWTQLKGFYDKGEKQFRQTARVYKMGDPSRTALNVAELADRHQWIRGTIWIRSVVVKGDSIKIQIKLWEAASHVLERKDGNQFTLPLDSVDALDEEAPPDYQDTSPGVPLNEGGVPDTEDDRESVTFSDDEGEDDKKSAPVASPPPSRPSRPARKTAARKTKGKK